MVVKAEDEKIRNGESESRGFGEEEMTAIRKKGASSFS
jgi:hypothetical protein